MICNRCKEDRDLDAFQIEGGRRRTYCNPCRNEQKRIRLSKKTTEQRVLIRQKALEDRHADPIRFMLYDAKQRAAKQGVPFDITKEDLLMPDYCPVLGILLSIGTGNVTPESPTLDKYDPSLGYVRGNVSIISHKANTMKLTATSDEVEMLLKWMRKREDTQNETGNDRN